jgi:hypothetical protein
MVFLLGGMSLDGLAQQARQSFDDRPFGFVVELLPQAGLRKWDVDELQR